MKPPKCYICFPKAEGQNQWKLCVCLILWKLIYLVVTNFWEFLIHDLFKKENNKTENKTKRNRQSIAIHSNKAERTL